MIELQSVIATSQLLIYFLFRMSMVLVQSIIHYFDGTRAHKAKIKDGTDSSGLVANVSHVVAVIRGIGMSIASDTHFTCWHENFVTVDYLLKPNISLYFIDANRAFFVECRPDVNISDTKTYPFYFIAQRENCIKTIEVPIPELVKLAKRIGEPKCQVGWIFHTSRCGSTLLVQGLNTVPHCTVISEPQEVLVHLPSIESKTGVNFKSYIESTELYDILSAAIIFILKDFRRDHLVCIKTSAALNYVVLPLINRRFPNHKFISLHRDGLSTAKSYWRMTGDHIVFYIGMYMLRTFPNILFNHMKTLLFTFTNSLLPEVKGYFLDEIDVFTFWYISWVTNIVTFQRSAKQLDGCQLLPLFYDDLQADKESMIMKVFKLLDIPTHHLNLALKAMEEDSQKGSPLDRNGLNNNKSWVRNENTVKLCNRVLKQFNLPDFDQKFRFRDGCEIETI